jgi:hypothetical protein
MHTHRDTQHSSGYRHPYLLLLLLTCWRLRRPLLCLQLLGPRRRLWEQQQQQQQQRRQQWRLQEQHWSSNAGPQAATSAAAAGLLVTPLPIVVNALHLYQHQQCVLLLLLTESGERPGPA